MENSSGPALLRLSVFHTTGAVTDLKTAGMEAMKLTVSLEHKLNLIHLDVYFTFHRAYHLELLNSGTGQEFICKTKKNYLIKTTQQQID